MIFDEAVEMNPTPASFERLIDVMATFNAALELAGGTTWRSDAMIDLRIVEELGRKTIVASSKTIAGFEVMHGPVIR